MTEHPIDGIILLLGILQQLNAIKVFSKEGGAMSVTIKKINVPSTDGIHALAGTIYIPNEEIKGIFHIAHGMTENMGRYPRIMNDLAQRGYLCVGFDCLGHGHTARDKSELGFIADKRGWDYLLRDVKQFAEAIKKEYGTDLPYYLMGHSMGSFIARLSSEKYFHPDKMIIMGTGGPNPLAGMGLSLIAINKAFYGPRHISQFIDRLVFGDYKKKKDNPNIKGSWLTTNLEDRKKYWSDDIGSFKFTNSAMGDLIKLMKYSNREAWFKKLPKDIPILLLSGDEDPVGNYGKGISHINDKLLKNGKNSKYILYKGARHEILNDLSYDDVINDIIEFIK